MVTQAVQLFRASVRENLTVFDPSIPDQRILEALDRLGLSAWLARLPHTESGSSNQLDAELAPGGTRLSAGEAQLLAFARVFLRNPGLVILDEASSRLDPGTERLLERAVDGLPAERTAILIAHRLSTLERADDIALVEDGRIVEHGPRATLAADPGSRYRALLDAGTVAGAKPPLPLGEGGGEGSVSARLHLPARTHPSPALRAVLSTPRGRGLEPRSGTRPVWWVVAQLIRARPGYFALCLLFATLTFGIPLGAGLVTGAFFDVLSGSAPAGLDVTTVIALFVAVAVVEMVAATGLEFGWGSFKPASAALLRRNLLRELLVAHGSRRSRRTFARGRRRARMRCWPPVRSAVLERDAEQLEHGLATPIGPRGTKLSGGQVQRAAAARMFVREPELLVFDDLSSALDVDTERLLWERLFADGKRTCLVVSHRPEAFRRADRVNVMKAGRVDAVGSLEELLRTNAEMRYVWAGAGARR